MYNLYFDMDGTIAALYDVPEWQNRLDRGDINCYGEAAPLVDMEELAELLSELQEAGVKSYVVSWSTFKLGIESIPAVAAVKTNWLEKYQLKDCFEDIFVTPYGEEKSNYIQDDREINVLFDGNRKVRSSWNGVSINPVGETIVNSLKTILEDVKMMG